jgi:DNA modification methylase
MEWNSVYVSDALAGVGKLPDESVQCCVTSPPYFRQRDYGVAGQWGQEISPEEYVNHLVELFRDIRRVLKDSGTVWLVLGDSYAGGGRGGQRGRQITDRHMGLGLDCMKVLKGRICWVFRGW